ncbi:hypothetical protein LCGC14_0421330 [marine sediment metagenome]|uniref:Uncharacterized protein n=1 Tax=marine sediment metagenome TaxID=412755 RepID=A0A0F9VCX3_9ZZZZ
MGERAKQRTKYFKGRIQGLVNAYEFMAYNLYRLERMLFIFEFTGVWTDRHPQLGERND